MAKLILNDSGTQIGEFPVNKECITIGRRPDNDIQIQSLAISGHHAQVITILNNSFVEDLNSTNGTFVNTQQIKKHALHDGDIIKLGNYQVKYVNELATPPNEARFERTVIITAPGAASEPGEENQAPIHSSQASTSPSSAVTAPPTHAKLQILSGANAGKQLELTKAFTTVGKPGVSVAAISRRDTGFVIIHVEGGKEKHVPRLNGDPISAKAQALNNHDIIEVAGVNMEFMLSS